MMGIDAWHEASVNVVQGKLSQDQNPPKQPSNSGAANSLLLVCRCPRVRLGLLALSLSLCLSCFGEGG